MHGYFHRYNNTSTLSGSNQFCFQVTFFLLGFIAIATGYLYLYNICVTNLIKVGRRANKRVQV